MCVCDVWLIASEHLKKKVNDPWHLAFLSSLSSLRKTADWSHELHKPAWCLWSWRNGWHCPCAKSSPPQPSGPPCTPPEKRWQCGSGELTTCATGGFSLKKYVHTYIYILLLLLWLLLLYYITLYITYYILRIIYFILFIKHYITIYVIY